MTSVDLRFKRAPLTQPATLLFNEHDSAPTIKDATVSADIALPSFGLIGTIAHAAVVAVEVELPLFTLESEVVYFTDTARPMTSQAAARWQDALTHKAYVEDSWQDGRRASQAVDVVFEDAKPQPAAFRSSWRDASRAQRQSVWARYQDALALRTAARFSFSDGDRRERPTVRTGFEDAVRLHRSVVGRFQDARRGIAGQHEQRYQDAKALQAFADTHFGTGRAVNRGWSTRYEDAVSPTPGRHDYTVIVTPPEPCYVPDPDLRFKAPMSADTHLVFVCEKHGGGPVDPELPAGVVVPIRRIYTVINSAMLRRVDGGVLIPNTAMSLTIDVDSWTWGFTARVPGAALPDLEPSGGVPVELEATINGVAYRAIVEGISRERVFGRSDLAVTGRGTAAVLDAPYAPVMNFGNAAQRTVQQLANDVLSFNGVPIGWDVNTGWQPADWLVPAGVFSHQGTYISALNAIAADAGAYVQQHRAEKALRVLSRYPSMPWEWADVSPDFELPSAVVQKEGTVWTDKPNYNRVFVRGMKAGRLGQATRQGTAGDIEAPMVTMQLGTNVVGLRQRARPVLADVGRQAAVSLRLPVLPETGIIPPGKFVRYVDAGVSRIGLVRSVSADVARSDGALTIWQTIGVETHV